MSTVPIVTPFQAPPYRLPACAALPAQIIGVYADAMPLHPPCQPIREHVLADSARKSGS